ncbi:MAG: ABC transporter ATP-binding protein [bacterium]|nr:ABC transporter ATP-binding protein [Gammaproteobacteria bacterium]
MPSFHSRLSGAAPQSPESNRCSETETRAPEPASADRLESASYDLSEAITSAHSGPGLKGSRRTKFFAYYRPYLGILAADLGCAVLVAATALALPLCANVIVKRITTAADNVDLYGEIYFIGVIMLFFIALQAICRLFVDYQGHVMGARMESAMRQELFEHYQKLSFSFYDRQRVGQLMSRISNDLFAISELYHHGPEDIAIAVLKFAGAFAILFYFDPVVTMIILISMPFAVLYALYFNNRMGVAVRQSKERVGAINEHVEDSLSGIRVVQSFGNQKLEMSRFNAENNHFLQTRRKGYKAEALFSVGLQTYTQLLTLMVIVFGTIAIVESNMSVADLMTFLLCVAILTDPIARAANLARLWQEGMTGFHRFVEVMEISPEIQDASGAKELVNVAGYISFHNVSFRYSEDADFAIKNISMEIKAGEFIALVGYSGVGKTTLCSLIPRFYDPTCGEILIDGHNIRQVSIDSLRRNIGLVHQDAYLFAGTIAENLAYGRTDASHAEIVEAAIRAQAHDFITALSKGYDTDIGERGVQLSGGQKQRLTIARAFLKNPPILIFDEATSALDSQSERAVQDALARIARDRTMIVIAHRLSTILHADRIIVLGDDGIAEQGTHDQLMSACGYYFRLHKAQASL